MTGDIRFYGLLKTIGTTPRQLRHIITQEALFLCIIGIPVGLLLGYGIGAVLTPIALETTSIIGTKAAISSSPIILSVLLYLPLSLSFVLQEARQNGCKGIAC